MHKMQNNVNVSYETLVTLYYPHNLNKWLLTE